MNTEMHASPSRRGPNYMSMPFDSAASSTRFDQETMTDSDSFEDAVAKHDPALNGSFYDENAPQATRYAMSIVHHWADAEEIAQEAFCRLIQSKSTQPTTDAKSNVKSILFTIVRNLAIDQLRSSGRHQFEPFDTSQIASRRPSANDARLETLENEIQDSLRKMPVQWSDAIQLKINGKLSYVEIAEVLDATHAQIRTWIYRARKQLEHDLLKKDLLGGSPDD